jgi:uncharacterized SAM-binding protein YcdF (DUF218 family)
VRFVVLGLIALVAAWLVACGVLFLWPKEDAPGRADAVVVLAGDASHRIPRGLELVESGVAERLVLSREPGQKWERWRPLCGRPSVVCFSARPYSTAGEAEAVARLAARRSWRSIVLVTSRYHIFRARILFRRCLPTPVVAAAASYDRRWLPLILPRETVKLIHALTVDRGCD